MRAKLSDLLFGVFGWLFASLFVWYFSVLLFGSAAPEPASGSTYEINLQGAKVYVRWFAYYLQYVLFFGALVCGLLASLISPRDPQPTDFTFSRYPITTAVGMICLASAMISMMIGFWLEVSQVLSESARQVLETIASVGVGGFFVSLLAIGWQETRRKRDSGENPPGPP